MLSCITLKLVEQTCRMNYHGSQDQSIDEAMIAFKGRSSMKQYMPMKPTKRRFKVWVRADSENGYVCQRSLGESYQVYQSWGLSDQTEWCCPRSGEIARSP